jgi:hypothetical protein
VIAVVVVACRRDPGARELLLTQLPGAYEVVVVADGAALADPGLRPTIERVRTRVPARFDCVIDAALASRTVAIAADRHAGIVVAVSTKADVRCPTLAYIGGDMWIATLGDATPATEPAASVARSARWERARRYLDDAPIAAAAVLGDRDLVAAARTAPLEAWIAIDDTRAERAERDLGELKRLTADLLRVRRDGSQWIAELSGPDPDTLARAADALLAAPAVPRVSAPACPVGLRCDDATHLIVPSVAGVLGGLHGAGAWVAVAGDVVGLRLGADAPPLFRRGDIVLGIDGTPLRRPDDLAAALRRVAATSVVAVRRSGADIVFHLRQNE